MQPDSRPRGAGVSHGETLEEHLLSVEKKQGIEPCAEELLDYLEFVKSLHKGASFEITEGFREVFGEHELPKETVARRFPILIWSAEISSHRRKMDRHRL